MIPLTRKENYLNEIVGWGNTAPEKPTTPEEFFFAAILGEAVQVPDLSNASRYELFLAKIAGYNVNISPPTYTSPRLEFFLAKAAGMDIETPVPITKEEIFWANYKGIEQIIEGVPPLTFKSNGANLSNYRIYGNTVNGESVGNLVESGEHTGEYHVPVKVNDVTTNFYLPETLRKVGSNADYVDYEERKIVKKTDYVVITSAGGWALEDSHNFYLTVSLQNAVSTTTVESNRLQSVAITLGQTKELGLSENIWVSGTGKINVWLESIEHTLEAFQAWLDEQPLVVQYKLAEFTDLPVTLPTLPTLAGTNTLSFETTVQPSKVMIKTGKFGTHKVRYYDSDGTFLSAEDVKDGANAQGFTPTKAITAQYSYTFMGWSTTKGSTTAETGVLNDITADKSLYAVFSQSLRMFTVYFYNGSTLLQTAENVQYGGTATYTGEAPIKDGFTFSGWQPSNVNITADTSCYAQFVEG